MVERGNIYMREAKLGSGSRSNRERARSPTPLSLIVNAEHCSGAHRTQWRELVPSSRASSRFALLVCHVTVASRSPREFGTATRAVRLGRRAGFLPLMSEEVAEGGELSSVATVIPALWLGSRSQHSDVVLHAGGSSGSPVAAVRVLPFGSARIYQA